MALELKNIVIEAGTENFVKSMMLSHPPKMFRSALQNVGYMQSILTTSILLLRLGICTSSGILSFDRCLLLIHAINAVFGVFPGPSNVSVVILDRGIERRAGTSYFVWLPRATSSPVPFLNVAFVYARVFPTEVSGISKTERRRVGVAYTYRTAPPRK